MTTINKSSNLTNVECFTPKNEPISNAERWILYSDIHSHCLNCRKPQKCMQKLPKYNVKLSEKDIFSVMLDIEYHRSMLNLQDTPTCSQPNSPSKKLLEPSSSHYSSIFSSPSIPLSISSQSSLSSSPSSSVSPFNPSQFQQPTTSSSSSSFAFYLPSYLKPSYPESSISAKKSTNIDKCPVIKCPNSDCNFIFHYCKLKEHLMICSYEKIKCLNCDYGCPFIHLRKNISSHLKHCPAMVVHCSVEWNRWPLHTTEKSLNTRAHYPSPALDTSNLDVALALRDQRMLKQLWSASRQMKRIMRGRFSLHPAVPIKPYIGIRTHREYGTSYSVTCSNNPNITNGNVQLSSSLPDSNLNIGDNTVNQQSEVLVVHHEEEKYIRFAQNLVDSAYNESLLEILKFTAENYIKKCNEIQEKNLYFQRKKANSICPSSKSDFEQFNSLQLSSSSSSINLPVLSDFFASEFRNSVQTNNNSGNSNNNSNSDDNQNQAINSQVSAEVFHPPLPPPVPKCNALSLELSICSYPCFGPKPRPMYTFRCGSNFRTDEITFHSRDIHSSIYGGLDGWIEYRCPLFQYGCTYVIRRWEPISGYQPSTSAQQQSSDNITRQTLIYNESLEAFACPDLDDCSNKLCYETSLKNNNRSISVASNYNDFAYFQGRLLSRRRSSNITLNGRIDNCSPSTKTNYSSASIFPNSRLSCPESPIWDCLHELNLLDLPFEILQHICSYLDPFTLNSLSFTSHSLRNVVKTFLKHRGYVALQWKRYEIEKGKYRWSVANKKWIFSTAISPINGWRMNSTSEMQKHLQDCTFYNRVEHKHPNQQEFLYLSDLKLITNDKKKELD